MASLKRLQTRYDRAIASKDYYSAEQTCRMMHHRLTNSTSNTPTQQSLDEAGDIVYNGSKTLLEHQQPQAGGGLALLTIKHLVQHKTDVSATMVDKLAVLAKLFDKCEGNDDEVKREKLRVIKAAIAWSSREDCGGFQNGHVQLNRLGAYAAAECEQFDLAQQLFIRSDDAEGAGNLIYDYATQHTLKSEHGLVLTRAILRYLLSENIKDANAVRRKFYQRAGWKSVSEEGNGEGVAELGNFCELVIKICQMEKRAAPLYERVCKSYEGEVKRDEELAMMLQKIGLMYFDVRPKQQGMGGMMNMLQGLMGN